VGGAEYSATTWPYHRRGRRGEAARRAARDIPAGCAPPGRLVGRCFRLTIGSLRPSRRRRSRMLSSSSGPRQRPASGLTTMTRLPT